jgi:hypothetical protein
LRTGAVAHILPAMSDRRPSDDANEARAREARTALDRLRHEGDSVGSSAMAQAARRAADHFAGRDAIGAAEHGETDPAELWGRRIGRGLSLAVFVVLVIYLWQTYLR